TVDPEILVEPAVGLLRAGEVDEGAERRLRVAACEETDRAVHHVASPDEMVATQVRVAFHLAPRDAERGDHRSRIRLVLVRQEEPVAGMVEPPAVGARARERLQAVAGAPPLLEEALAVLREGEAERLQQCRRGMVQALPEGEAQRELTALPGIELAH